MESHIVRNKIVFDFNALRIGRQIIFILLMLLINNSLICQPTTMWQIMEDNTIVRWVYTGGDEFDGDALDHLKWFTCEDGWDRDKFNPDNPQCSTIFYGGDGSGEDNQAIQSTNIKQENGKLRLIINNNSGMYRVTRFHDNGNPYETLAYKEYTAGWIQLKMKYKYGLFEINCRLPCGSGINSAFWLYGGYPEDQCEFPDEEFDIFESNGGKTSSLHFDVHQNNNLAPHDWFNFNVNFTNSFNTIIGSWYSDSLNFHYLGDYVSAKEKVPWNLKNSADLIISSGVWIDADCPILGEGVNSSTVFPAYFDIDYVRIWSLINCTDVVNVCNYEQTAEAPTVYTGRQITLGGQNCDVFLGDKQYLKLFATEKIALQSGFHAKAGSNFFTNLVDCPAPINRMSDQEGSIDTSTLLKNLEINNAVEENKSLSSNNPPKLYARIFPNPTDGKVRIEFSGEINPENMKIELINSNGQIVYSGNEIELNTIEIDITALPKGTYILLGFFGNNTISEKILLQ